MNRVMSIWRRSRRLIAATVLLLAPCSATLPDAIFLEEDFEGDLSRWTLSGEHSIEVLDSGDAAHGKVLQLGANGDAVYALVEGSQRLGPVRVEADFLFPDDAHSYLGLIYNYTANDERIDFGQIYIKGNESYLRANPVRDGNVSRLLYEEYRTPLTGDGAIIIGRWHRLMAEIDGATCHFYVDEFKTPRMVFDLFEQDSGFVGFKPRVVGGSVWIDNVRVTSIDQLAYTGPPIPRVEYKPNQLITDWQVLGPLRRPAPEVEIDPTTSRVVRGKQIRSWRPFETDRRGAVITGRITEFFGDEPVAYFRTSIRSQSDTETVLHFTTTDEIALFVNGIFEGFVYRDGYVSGDNDWNAWYDFWTNPDHAGRRVPVKLRRGPNRIVLRVRNGQYASGGFFVRSEPRTR